MPRWPALLRPALDCLDELARRAPSPPRYAIGGGTALMVELAHRRSRDIDIFLDDAQLLTLLTPRRNDRVALLAGDYVESSNFLKLRLPAGEIDFILAPSLTPAPHRRMRALRREIVVETPVEIAVKKCFYRAADFRLRDVFDLAVVIEHCRAELVAAEPVLRPKRELLLARVEALRPDWAEAARAALDPLPAGGPYLERAPAVVLDFLRAL